MAIGAKALQRFTELQDRCQRVGDIRGLGAMVGMEFVTDRKTQEPTGAFVKDLVARCREKGLLLISAGTYSNVTRRMMPHHERNQRMSREPTGRRQPACRFP